MYWSKECLFEKVAQTMPMSVNRSEQIKNFIHINDNQFCPENCVDKLYNMVDYMLQNSTNYFHLTSKLFSFNE